MEIELIEGKLLSPDCNSVLKGIVRTIERVVKEGGVFFSYRVPALVSEEEAENELKAFDIEAESRVKKVDMLILNAKSTKQLEKLKELKKARPKLIEELDMQREVLEETLKADAEIGLFPYHRKELIEFIAKFAKVQVRTSLETGSNASCYTDFTAELSVPFIYSVKFEGMDKALERFTKK